MVLFNGKTTSRKFSIISEANYAYIHVNKVGRYANTPGTCIQRSNGAEYKFMGIRRGVQMLT